MNRAIPKRLRQEPLIEAIWQVQFDSSGNQPLGDILPGVLFSAFRSEQPGLKLNRLPIADIPPFVAQNDPNLRFSAKYRIEAPEWPFLLQIGDRVVTVNCRRPYVGWSRFKERIIALVDVLDTSGFMPEPLRYSLRYIDLMTLGPSPALSFLQLALQIGDHSIEKHPLQMRVEIPGESCTYVLQVATQAQARFPEGERAGTLIDLETVADSVDSGWSTIRDGLESLHDNSKIMFFQQILTSEAIERMDPEY